MYLELLKTWCDQLIELQLTDYGRLELDGGMMCPACGTIHGRSGDAIYPLMVLYRQSRDSKYLEAAKLLFKWSKHNVICQDGSTNNDLKHTWKGVTIFWGIQLGKALMYHGELLDSATRQQWEQQFQKSVDYTIVKIASLTSNVNYLMSAGALLSLGGGYFNESSYREVAAKYVQESQKFFTAEGLLFGEGSPKDGLTKKGFHPIDIGYNVEESLGNLALYAWLEKDEALTNFLKKSLTFHANFMLPDGAWDNSWGSRNYKWTYWGSRTTDGCQLAYGLLGKDEPLFQEVLKRNLKLLTETTHNGLLHGGPMYAENGIPPCVHHTFCHAKGIATMVDFDLAQVEHASGKLPLEEADAILQPMESGVSLVKHGVWRLTVTENDFAYRPEASATGGALTLVHHEVYGPLIAGTTTTYELIEPHNMQLPKEQNVQCQTPRIEQILGNDCYTNLNDRTATVEIINQEPMEIISSGVLCNRDGVAGAMFQQQLTVGRKNLIVSLEASEESRFYLPLIASLNAEVQHVSDNEILIKQLDKPTIRLTANQKCQLNQHQFNPIGGFVALPFEISLNPAEKITITLELINEKE
ncbi:hypothetical protein ACWOFR_00990 [Carnobacterium gallinarum]|uniref:hypothetical protein n=1 Tax=Carnobacterium gallinarum TaxID=2749 RepID=UPI000689701B|nr:hypothetical protein [Carnobacterium gallinarum]